MDAVVVVEAACVEGVAKENPTPPNAPADVVAGLDPVNSPPKREVGAVVVVAESGAPPNLKPNINHHHDTLYASDLYFLINASNHHV